LPAGVQSRPAEIVATSQIVTSKARARGRSRSRASAVITWGIPRASSRSTAHDQLVSVVRGLAVGERDHLESLKGEHTGLQRPDFIWHYPGTTAGRAACAGRVTGAS